MSYRRFIKCVLSALTGTILATGICCAETEATRYLLLRTDHMLHGTVSRLGDTYVVRPAGDAELRVPIEHVIAISEDREQLFQKRSQWKHRGQINRVAVLLDDARWCIDQGLPDIAARNLGQVYQIAPNHPLAIVLEERLRSTAAESCQAEGSSETVVTVSYEAAVANPTTQSEISDAALDPTLVHSFTRNIQPLLIARCARCHHDKGPSELSWQLHRPVHGRRATRDQTIENLQATIPWCRGTQPQDVPLYRYAIKPHGDHAASSRAPIAAHEQFLLRRLQDWIALVQSVADAAETKPIASSMASAAAMQERTTSDSDDQPPMAFEATSPAAVERSLSPPPAGKSTDLRSRTGTVPQRLPPVEKINDVDLFNRQTRILRKLRGS